MANWIIETVTAGGYLGVFMLMLLENIFPPIPSELILPFAGFAVASGQLGLAGVLAAATAGAMLGALPWYFAGVWLGQGRLKALAARAGRWLCVSPRDIDDATAWFRRFGAWAVLLGRLVPGIRTVISVPAGIARMPFGLFMLVSTLGTLAWNGLLLAAGLALHDNYAAVEGWVDPVSKAVLALSLATYVWRVATWGWRDGRG